MNVLKDIMAPARLRRAREAIGNAVEMALDIEVVIDPDTAHVTYPTQCRVRIIGRSPALSCGGGGSDVSE